MDLRSVSRFGLGVEEPIFPEDEENNTWSAFEQNLRWRRPLSKTTDSEFTTRLVREWIDNCVRHHSLCETSETHCPTRLIDVELSSDCPDDLRLVDLTNGMTKADLNVRYLALSHCWGNSSAEDMAKKTTTTANLEQRMTSISLSTLPTTFQDAVKITRLLGERYLWIDSLCIIQDSLEDWERESFMGHIYRAAVCTIAANDARDSTQGIFTARNIPESILYPAKKPNKLPEESQPLTIHPILPKWKAFFPSGRLNTRAWTLQERQLSRRIVHYTSQEVFWECACTSTSESFPGEGLSPGRGRMYLPSFKQTIGPAMHRLQNNRVAAWATMTPDEEQNFRDGEEIGPGSPYQVWYDLVANFSARDITFPNDFLPALSGVARGLAEKINDDYVAGLWRKDILFGLCWRKNTEISQTVNSQRTCTEWRAPSWSWASTGVPVVFGIESGGDNPFVPEILQLSCTPLSERNPFGAIKEASLRVKGLMVTLFYSSRDDRLSPLANLDTQSTPTQHGAKEKLGQDASTSESKIVEERSLLSDTMLDKMSHGIPDTMFDSMFDEITGLHVSDTMLDGIRNTMSDPMFDEFPRLHADDDSMKPQDGEPVHCLYIDWDPMIGVFALGLLPVANRDNEYKRIGWVNAESDVFREVYHKDKQEIVIV